MSMKNRIGLGLAGLGIVALFTLQGKNDNEATPQNEQPDMSTSIPEAPNHEVPTLHIHAPLPDLDLYDDIQHQHQSSVMVTDGDDVSSTRIYISIDDSSPELNLDFGFDFDFELMITNPKPTTSFGRSLNEILKTMTTEEQVVFLGILIESLEKQAEIQLSTQDNGMTREQVMDMHPSLEL